MTLEKIVVGPMRVNCYILASKDRGEAIIIDPGAEGAKIKRRLLALGLKAGYIVNTHGHADHIGANAAFDVPVYIHRLDGEFLTNPELNFSAMFGAPLVLPAAQGLLEDGQRIEAAGINLEVIHTPGHTPGGICLNAGEFVFTGDTLFAQGIGRFDLPYASEKDLLDSIRKKLISLPDETIIYPGHGPSSTIGQERKSNPFING